VERRASAQIRDQWRIVWHLPDRLDGKRACPPEDVGGVWEYAELLETLNDPEHPDFDEMSKWVGGYFDPEAFDIDEVNAQLRSIKRR